MENSEMQNDKKDALRKVGNFRQLCGVRRMTIGEGKADGQRLYQVYNAKGLEMTLVESRCLDIYDLRYKGINIPFMSKPGLVGVAHGDLHGINFLRSIGGGMLYTCGLSNVGAAYSDDNGDHIFHGRLRFIPAENPSSFKNWENGTCTIGVQGEMRDAALFKDNLVLQRTVTTTLYGKIVTIKDVIENQGFEPQDLMLMYHVNTGYPLLDEGVEVFIPSSETIPMNEAAKAGQSGWREVMEPVDGYDENVFIHKLKHDADSRVWAGLYNNKLQMGISLSFNSNMLENLLQWKSMKTGDYALGLQPTNCFANGKEYEINNGSLQRIDPFAKKEFELNIGILDGEQDKEEFLKKFNSCDIKQ